MSDISKVEEFLATARSRFQAAAEEEKELRGKFISDLKFASPDGDEQWDPQLKMQREAAGRPAMSFPRCHTFVQQVSNEARQNKPQIKFAPRRDADKDTAEIYEGLARYIQYTSDAEVAYETAIEYSAGGSFGYYRFLTDYVDDDSDDQELKVVPVLDPLTIYGILVPACFGRKPRFAFVVEDMPKDEFKAQYPDSEIASLDWPEAERRGSGWVGQDSIRVAEYWYIEEEKQEGRRRPKSRVKFCKTNGIEVLADSETVWAGSSIPIVPVLGKQMIMEGKPKLFSVIRPQKGAQQLINYSKSRIAETLSVSPVSPWVADARTIAGYEKEWQTANTVVRAYLPYLATDEHGNALPAPERQTFEPPIQALSAFVAQEVDDMKATTGIFDASLGQNGNETSGQAILRRQQQANMSTLHFMDNLERSFKQGGEIIAEMIPLIYDTEREIAILGEDEAQRVVTINGLHTDEKGKEHHYDMTKGKYGLVVTMGRAFSSKRKESFDTMEQVLQTNPGLMPIIGDIFFRNSDMAGADQLAERFKKNLPPNLQDGDQEQIPPQAQAAIQQLQQHNQALNAACQHYEGQIQQLTFEKQAQIVQSQGKIELEKLRIEGQITIAEINTKAQQISERVELLHDTIKQLMSHSHDRALSAQEHAQDILKASHAGELAQQPSDHAASQTEQTQQ